MRLEIGSGFCGADDGVNDDDGGVNLFLIGIYSMQG